MEQSLDEIEANKFLQMRAKFERSREYAYWQALIFNKVNAWGTQQNEIDWSGNDSNLLIVFYVQIMPDDFIMQLHRF
ncbi:Uncharacterised protein [Klebsiella pneumoniae]|nr:Uncharacterised protein [Klebsiella pneumoniae]